MKKFSRGFTMTAATLAVLGTSLGGAFAYNNADDNRFIIGGEQATNPWIVQLNFKSYEQPGTFGCTGEQLNEEWVLTAKHCTEDSYNMQVFQSNDQENPGQPIYADGLYNSPKGDVALIHLSEDAPLNDYADLDFSYVPTVGDSGDVYGYGLGANKQPTTTLRGASVNVIGNSYDAYFGNAVHIRGVDGGSNHGDSGGPFIVDGKVVAVCSTGDKADPGADINAQSNYALLSQAENFIVQTTGIDFNNDPAPSEEPTEAPSEEPTAEPTADPVVTDAPSEEPTAEPTDSYDPWEDNIDWNDDWSWSDSGSTGNVDWNTTVTNDENGTHWKDTTRWSYTG